MYNQQEKLDSPTEEMNLLKLRYDFAYKAQVEQLARDFNKELFKHKVKDKILCRERNFQEIKISQSTHLMKMPSI
jgi:hypothetical protein